ncbi:hypothetical protein [Sphingobium yanoikuyae]|uniref:hypothetical protein n=1 Tax=Sphingobium yanoikuyae TaxID=13690 RepID=UPI000262C872|nr:hypothetical protein [Sphingobium yanoikuyae]
MSAADIFTRLGEDDADEPWFIEPKDRDPEPELKRQMAFLSMLARLGPACDAVAIPNAGKATDWERVQRWKEGARAGALDLLITWSVDLPGHGVFLAEFKDGKKMPTPAQRDRLNRYYRQGHGCGVFRKPETLIAHLRAAGAPIAEARA